MIEPGIATSESRSDLMPALQAAADLAIERRGGCESRLDLAGLHLRVRFAGAALRDLMLPAMAHAVTPRASAPDLDVAVWDSAQSGVALPTAAGIPADHTPFAFSRVPRRGSVQSLFDPWSCSLTALDLARGVAVHWLPDAARPLDAVRSAPLQALLNWWLAARGRAAVHGAGVSAAGSAVLLLGPSGSGKSTAALACVEAGFGYLGDDLCAVVLEPEPFVHAVYGSAKLVERDLERFPGLASCVVNPERGPSDKAIAYLDRRGPGVVERGRPLRATIVLGAKGLASPEILPLSPAAALRAIAPGTFMNFFGHGQSELAALARLVTRVPCYRMGLAHDIDANTAALRALLEAAV